ncbi:MAG: hypothetical protein ABSB09_08835 [Acidimicrobiales bacterium]
MTDHLDDDLVPAVIREMLESAGRTAPPMEPTELRRRARRRLSVHVDPKLLVAVAAVVVLVAALFGAGTFRNSAHLPTTTVHTRGTDLFLARPVLCLAAPFEGRTSSQALEPIPSSCSPDSALTAARLDTTPSNGGGGWTMNLSSIPPDASFAPYPSTSPGDDTAGSVVLLPGAPGTGPDRYLLGPAQVTGADVASATAELSDGQWSVDITLTPTGSTAWDSLAEQQFHALVAIELNGQVLSAPITEPTEVAFSSFSGKMQIGGEFTESQATTVAAEITSAR